MDIEALLKPLSEEAPCGEDLTYDAEFMALEQAAQGAPEQQVGDSIIDATPPDYTAVSRGALALFKRTRDLRVAMHLVVGSLKTGGLLAFRDALEVLLGLLERYWEPVHPLLDPDDDNDPTERLNIVAALAPRGAANDPGSVLRHLREVPLTDSRQLGRFGLRHILIAEGEAAPIGDEPAPTRAMISAAFQDTDLDHLQALLDAAIRSSELVTAIEAALDRAVGSNNSPNLGEARTAIGELQRRLQSALAERGVGDGPVEEGSSGHSGSNGGGGGGGGGGQAITGDIRSVKDVTRMLDKICDFYAKSEPSSPIPLLLRRAQRLVEKDFVAILKDLARDGLSEFEKIAGQHFPDED